MLLRQKGRTPLGVIVVVVIAVLQISGSSDVSDDDMCDLRSWYEEAQSVGAFGDDSTPEVTSLEDEIKDLLEAKGEDATVKCSTLRGYEEIIYDMEEEGEEGEEGEVEEGGGKEEGEMLQEGMEDDELEGLLQDDEASEQPKTQAEPKVAEKDEKVEEEEPNSKEEEQVKQSEQSEKQDKEEEAPEKEGKPAEQVKEAETDPKDKGVTLSKGTTDKESCTKSGQNDCGGVKEETGDSEEEPTEGKDEVKAEESKEPLTPDAPTPPADTPAPSADADRGRSEAELLAARLLVEQARTEYGGKIKDLEMQLLKLENRMLVERTEQTNTTNSFTKVENQVLKLENELLRINASFSILRAENAQLRVQMATAEGKGQQYPALPDNNTTMVSNLVTSHQSRITELSDVITKQSDVIKALDEKAGLLEERNGELRETLVDQADMIKDILGHIEDLRVTQEKQKNEQEKETKRLYDVIASVEVDKKKEELVKSGSDNLKLPDTQGGSVEAKADNGNDLKGSTVELPAGSDGKTDEKEEVGEASSDSQKQPNLPQVDNVKPAPEDKEKVEGAVEGTKEKEEEKKGAQEIEKEEVLEKKPSKTIEEKAPSEKQEDAPKPKAKPKTKKTGAKKAAKPKKKAAKKKGDKKKVVKKAKVTKKALPVPKPLYVDDSYKEMKDCYSHYSQGRKRDTPMRIRPVGQLRDSDVFCDMRNGGWTVIMRRQDGSMDFYRDWAEYKRGFGGTYGDHFVGLDLIHKLTNQGDYQLRVDLTDWNRNSAFALYDLIRVEGEGESYRLHISGYSGTAGDGFLGHSGMKFSTHDKDNDLAVKDFGGSCATRFHGAWWYNKCYKSNLTGKYYRGGKTEEGMYDGVAWKPWTGSDVSLKRVELKIRPKV